MIEHIRTSGFKGFDLDEDVPQKVIYTGKNKSGKSSRSGAIALALYGNIPFSTVGKRPSDILDSFGEESLVVAVTINGTEFGRKFASNAKGQVSQIMQVDKKRVSSENFAVLLNKAGAPKIADVSEFMKQSEAKKIDTLLELYPIDNLAAIDNEIAMAKEDVSRLDRDIKGINSTISRLTYSKQQIELPSGSISEVQTEIKSIDSQVEKLLDEIKQAEISEAEARAKAEGERQEKERADRISAQKKVDPIDVTITRCEKQLADFKSNNNNSGNPPQNVIEQSFSPVNATNEPVVEADYSKSIASIERIIVALTSVGCDSCAALIVAKQELKKYKGVL